MSTLIKEIDKDTRVVFDQGRFDGWCVYIISGHKSHAPKDIDYFNYFVNLADQFTPERVYDDFCKVYSQVTEKVEDKALNLIVQIAKGYPKTHSRDVELNLVVIYAGMIAERNKKYTKLKERIKRLGMHQILLLNYPVGEAVNFSKDRGWRELDKICSDLGF